MVLFCTCLFFALFTRFQFLNYPPCLRKRHINNYFGRHPFFRASDENLSIFFIAEYLAKSYIVFDICKIHFSPIAPFWKPCDFQSLNQTLLARIHFLNFRQNFKQFIGIHRSYQAGAVFLHAAIAFKIVGVVAAHFYDTDYRAFPL